jgi:hypothetical protein
MKPHKHTSKAGHVITIIFAVLGFLCLAAWFTLHLVYCALKHTEMTIAVIFAVAMVIAAFFAFLKPYPCEHGQGSICEQCEKEGL